MIGRGLLGAAVILLGIVDGAVAADNPTAPSGPSLHEKNCLRCHGSEVYTRPNHRVTSRSALEAQVRTCDQSIGLQWFDDEIKAVADYLDHTYYHFK
jgi:hypothetical protein